MTTVLIKNEAAERRGLMELDYDVRMNIYEYFFDSSTYYIPGVHEKIPEVSPIALMWTCKAIYRESRLIALRSLMLSMESIEMSTQEQRRYVRGGLGYLGIKVVHIPNRGALRNNRGFSWFPGCEQKLSQYWKRRLPGLTRVVARFSLRRYGEFIADVVRRKTIRMVVLIDQSDRQSSPWTLEKKLSTLRLDTRKALESIGRIYSMHRRWTGRVGCIGLEYKDGLEDMGADHAHIYFCESGEEWDVLGLPWRKTCPQVFINSKRTAWDEDYSLGKRSIFRFG